MVGCNGKWQGVGISMAGSVIESGWKYWSEAETGYGR